MINDLATEGSNPDSVNLDLLSTIDLVHLINAEDAKVAQAVAAESESIARAIDIIAKRLEEGGRLIYVGAGTSGRLGILDAAECPPTFSCAPGQVVALIAGGPGAVLRAVEGAEDSTEQGQIDLAAIDLAAKDVVVGIAASGRTPYVLGALRYANAREAATIAFSCNQDAEIATVADLAILPLVGPEVLSGSTRMKAGTATKLVLNMLTTGAMVRLGKVYGNLMVDLQATNEKLLQRSVHIVQAATQVTSTMAKQLLQASDGELKTAIVSYRLGLSADAARRHLESCGGRLREALDTA